jgi:hypothetical protein
MPITSQSPVPSLNLFVKAAGQNDKSGIAEQVKQLNKAHSDLDLAIFETAKLKTIQEVEAASTALETALKKAIPTACDQAKKLAALAKTKGDEFKKKPDTAKSVAPAAAAIAKEAAAYVAELEKTAAEARAALKAQLATLAAEQKKQQELAAKQAKKDAGDEKEDKDAEAEAMADEKDEKKFKETLKKTMKGWLTKLQNASKSMSGHELAQLRACQGKIGLAKFRMASLGKTFGVAIGKANGEAERKIAMRMADLKSGFKDARGFVYWDPEAKVYIFEGPSVAAGAANSTALKLALKGVLGYAPKVRLQKPGERGEDSEGPDEADPEAAAEQAAAPQARETGVDPTKAFTARLGALMPRIQAAMRAGGPDAEKLRKAVADAGDLAQKRNVAGANALLDGIERQLAAGRGAEATASAQAQQIGRAREGWVRVRTQFDREVRKLAGELDEIYREEPDQRDAVRRAKDELNKAADRITGDLEGQLEQLAREQDARRRDALRATAKRTLESVQKLLAEDPLLKELDGNELNPGLVIVRPMQERLREVSAALG